MYDAIFPGGRPSVGGGRPKPRRCEMTRTVRRAGLPPGLLAWVAVGITLTAAARVHAEPLVSRLRQAPRPEPGQADRAHVGFEVAPGGRAPAPAARPARRRPSSRTLEV